MYVAYS